MLNDPSTIEELVARISRLEASNHVQWALNDYFYLLDSGRTDELLDVFTDDVSWSASNIPFGSGQTMKLHGRSQVRPVVEVLGYGGFRHHGMNVDINVDETAGSATTASYMLVISRSRATTGAVMLLGGLYEGTWVREPDRWRIASWHVSNQWMVDGVADEKFFDGLREGTRWNGRARLEAQ